MNVVEGAYHMQAPSAATSGEKIKSGNHDSETWNNTRPRMFPLGQMTMVKTVILKIILDFIATG